MDSPLYSVSKASNVFEFLALPITLWLLLLNCKNHQFFKNFLLVLGDSTSALGWLFHARGIPATSLYHNAVNMVAVWRSTH
jgi:hypothetical protein